MPASQIAFTEIVLREPDKAPRDLSIKSQFKKQALFQILSKHKKNGRRERKGRDMEK